MVLNIIGINKNNKIVINIEVFITKKGEYCTISFLNKQDKCAIISTSAGVISQINSEVIISNNEAIVSNNEAIISNNIVNIEFVTRNTDNVECIIAHFNKDHLVVCEIHMIQISCDLDKKLGKDDVFAELLLDRDIVIKFKNVITNHNFVCLGLNSDIVLSSDYIFEIFDGIDEIMFPLKMLPKSEDIKKTVGLFKLIKTNNVYYKKKLISNLLEI